MSNTMIDNLIYDLYLERRIREYCLTKLESKLGNIRDLWSKYEIELRKEALENSDIITGEEAYKEFLNRKDVSEKQNGGSKLLSDIVSVGSILKRKRLDIYVKVVRKDEHYIYLSYYDVETKQTSQEIMRHEKWMIDAGYEKYITRMPNTYLGASKSRTKRTRGKNKRKTRRKTMKKHRN